MSPHAWGSIVEGSIPPRQRRHHEVSASGAAGRRRPACGGRDLRSLTLASYRRTCCMDVPFWVWALTIAAIVGHARSSTSSATCGHRTHRRSASPRSGRPSTSASPSSFGLLICWFAGAQYGGEYFAGYITEKSLSVDNLFVFVLIMAQLRGAPGAAAEGAAVRHHLRAGAPDGVHPRRRRGHRELQLGLLPLRRASSSTPPTRRPGAAGTPATRTTRRTPSCGSPAASCRRPTSTTPTG